MKIERERFEAFIASKNPESRYDFNDCIHCLMSQFIRSQISTYLAASGVDHTYLVHSDGHSEDIKWPDWIMALKLEFKSTFGQVQDAYITLFGDQRLDTVEIPDSIMGQRLSEKEVL